MIFKDKGKTYALGYTETQLMDTIFVMGRKFFTLNNKIVELLINSTCDLYAENKCSVIHKGKQTAYGGTSQTAATSSLGSYKSGGAFYDINMPEDFEFKPYNHYWLRRNGELNKFTNIRQLMKLYDDRTDLFKAYVKENDIKFDNQESIVRLIDYLEIQ
jgi:hypothetical protein